jgi:hypothetical protein
MAFVLGVARETLALYGYLLLRCSLSKLWVGLLVRVVLRRLFAQVSLAVCVECSVDIDHRTASQFRLSVLVVTRSLAVSPLFLDDELLSAVCIDAELHLGVGLRGHGLVLRSRILLHGLLLLVLFQTFFRLIRCQLGVRSAFGHAVAAWLCLLLRL